MRLMTGEALTLTTAYRRNRALFVCDLARVVPEIEFRKVTMQVLLAALLIKFRAFRA